MEQFSLSFQKAVTFRENGASSVLKDKFAKSLSHKIKIPQVPQREKSAKMSRELCGAN
jgi:hypothetical protein